MLTGGLDLFDRNACVDMCEESIGQASESLCYIRIAGTDGVCGLLQAV